MSHLEQGKDVFRYCMYLICNKLIKILIGTYLEIRGHSLLSPYKQTKHDGRNSFNREYTGETLAIHKLKPRFSRSYFSFRGALQSLI